MPQVDNPSVSSNTNGVVNQAIASLQIRRVQYQVTSWKARLHESVYLINLLLGQPISISSHEGLTLIVALWHYHISVRLGIGGRFTFESMLRASYAMEEAL